MASRDAAGSNIWQALHVDDEDDDEFVGPRQPKAEDKEGADGNDESDDDDDESDEKNPPVVVENWEERADADEGMDVPPATAEAADADADAAAVAAVVAAAAGGSMRTTTRPTLNLPPPRHKVGGTFRTNTPPMFNLPSSPARLDEHSHSA